MVNMQALIERRCKPRPADSMSPAERAWKQALRDAAIELVKMNGQAATSKALSDEMVALLQQRVCEGKHG